MQVLVNRHRSVTYLSSASSSRLYLKTEDTQSPGFITAMDVTGGTILIPHVTWSLPEAPTSWEREKKGAKSQSIFWSIRLYTDARPPLTMPRTLTILLLLAIVPWSGLAHLCTDTTRFAPSETRLCPSLAQVSIFLRKAQLAKLKCSTFFLKLVIQTITNKYLHL